MREGLHCLAIENCTLDDQGTYTAATNKDTTSCVVAVAGIRCHCDIIFYLKYLEYPHKFVQKLDAITTVTEDDRVTFEVEVEGEDAQVVWFHDNTQFQPERSR